MRVRHVDDCSAFLRRSTGRWRRPAVTPSIPVPGAVPSSWIAVGRRVGWRETKGWWVDGLVFGVAGVGGKEEGMVTGYVEDV
jgi:hypothetical protein